MKCLCYLTIIGNERALSQRGDDKRNGDLIPPMPFHLRPSGMAIYMRQKVGKACLLRLARTPFTPINIKDVVKPVGEFNPFDTSWTWTFSKV